MKVLLINGSPNRLGCTFTALSEVANALHVHNIETAMFQIGHKPVAGCMACMCCKNTGRCVIDDCVQEAQVLLQDSDGIVIGTPVYYSAPSGTLVSFLNRLFFSYSGDLSGKLGASIVSCRRGGASAAFEQLNQYFLMHNMPVVASQYWNSVHGIAPDDVLKDCEGMQTMRTLATNIAWLLKCIEAGKKTGIERPHREAVIETNFIR